MFVKDKMIVNKELIKKVVRLKKAKENWVGEDVSLMMSVKVTGFATSILNAKEKAGVNKIVEV